MRHYILPALAVFALAACGGTNTEHASSANGSNKTNASLPTHSDAATANANQTANNQATTIATSTNQTTQQGRITIQEAQALIAKGEAVVVDVRPASAYNASHIKGAINIPEGEIAARASELPKGKKIITYCS